MEPLDRAREAFAARQWSVCIFVALRLEERDLLDELGDDYRAYRRRVPLLVPGLKRHATTPHRFTP